MQNENLRTIDQDEIHQQLSSTEEILEDARQGRMFILVDAEDRENEGDLIIPAQMATPGRDQFHGALRPRPDLPRHHAGAGATQLHLHADGAARTSPGTQRRSPSPSRRREGITTGISAYDRSHTIAVAINPEKDSRDIVSPGHVFPLVAREGGVLVRAGHTEAAVDLARLAGLLPAGVICEIMNDDGTMARHARPFAVRAAPRAQDRHHRRFDRLPPPP